MTIQQHGAMHMRADEQPWHHCVARDERVKSAAE